MTINDQQEVKISNMADVLKVEWLRCPVCNNKARTKMRQDATLKNYPLYCPKCKREILVDVQELTIKVLKEPNAKAQSHNMKKYMEGRHGKI